jgi:hypothetical protein
MRETYVPGYLFDSLKDHVLKNVVDEKDVRIFTMRRPGTGMFRVQLTFTVEGIALQGDVTFGPQSHGISSALNYDEHWFATYPKLTEEYLCEKFLRHEFVPRSAAEYMEDILQQQQEDEEEDYGITDEMIPGWRKLIENLKEDQHFTAERLFDDLEELEYEHDGEGFGWDYNPEAAAMLCAVQQTFARLFLWACPQLPSRQDSEQYRIPANQIIHQINRHDLNLNNCVICGTEVEEGHPQFIAPPSPLGVLEHMVAHRGRK